MWTPVVACLAPNNRQQETFHLSTGTACATVDSQEATTGDEVSQAERHARKRERHEQWEREHDATMRAEATKRATLIANIAATLEYTSLPEFLADMLLDPQRFVSNNT